MISTVPGGRSPGSIGLFTSVANNSSCLRLSGDQYLAMMRCGLLCTDVIICQTYGWLKLERRLCLVAYLLLQTVPCYNMHVIVPYAPLNKPTIATNIDKYMHCTRL